MPKIRLIEKNKERINKLLCKANGQARERTIYDYNELEWIVKRCRERLMAQIHGSAKTLDGIKVAYAYKCELPKAYKYEAKTTFVKFIFTKYNYVTVTDAFRGPMRRTNVENYECELTKNYIDSMVEEIKKFT